jgi:2-(1,2-epoxy-1,2-dihydrophenyl)acetyl-CoA isomerase
MDDAAPASTDSAAVQREIRGGLTILSISRPKTLNALTEEVKEALCCLIPAFFADSNSRCLLLTGSGDAFCAGGDLKTLTGGHTPAQTRIRLEKSHRWVHPLLTGEKPVITAVNGAAVGAGFSLALLGDIVLASARAYFVAGFPAVGVAADLGLALTLSRSVGASRAKDILLSNRRVEADEAARLGFVSRLVQPDDLMGEAIRLGEKLASGPTLAIGLTKSLINTAFEVSASAFLEAEIAAQSSAFGSADCLEGVDAFFSKRAARFRGS